MVRLLWLSVGLCGLALVILAIALWRVNDVSAERDQQFKNANRAAIILNCQEIENVKASLRAVFKRITRFNIKVQTPAADLRAKLYRDFVHDYFAPNTCPRKGGIP